MLEIYYIEDDETIAGTVKEYLEQCGYRVSIFGTIVGEGIPGTARLCRHGSFND